MAAETLEEIDPKLQVSILSSLDSDRAADIVEEMDPDAAADLLEKLPEDLKNSPEAKLLSTAASRKVYNIIHLIYRARNYEGHSKDYEFSRFSMEEHWRSGYHDARRTLRQPEVLERPTSPEGVFTFDLHRDGRD